jgi:thymidylate synthase ThyX
MPDSSIANAAPPERRTNSSNSEVSVFAVHGADPEVQAYAMAKYSRSALSMKESLKEISEQKAEQFLNTFYFQYGHRSIADLAHVAVAVEKLSILAAIILVDEQRWDGQERSTRYQNFKKSGYYVPDFGGLAPLRQRYCETADFLFAEYEAFTPEMLRYYSSQVPKPADMTEEAYTRTLRARAFDNSRYLLPLATNTSLGQIVNARTLETQIARLLASPYDEVRRLGKLLTEAAREPAFNAQSEALRSLVDEIKAVDSALGSKAEEQLLRAIRVAPTLMKYANPSDYEIKTRQELMQAAAEIMRGVAIQPAPVVDLVDDEPLEVGLAATLIYSACHHSYRQVCQQVQGLTGAQRDEIIDLGQRYRGRFDELSRAFHAGQRFCFDILMDIGGFRDMHRHRRCTQIEQGFTRQHGYDTPPDLVAAGLQPRYAAAMERVGRAQDQIKSPHGIPDPSADVYLLPLAFRKRTLFKMDFAEAVYIAELRSAPAGHFSYRNVAYAMYEAVARNHPSLARYFRISGPVTSDQPADLLRR